MSKIKKACDISPQVRLEVLKRDQKRCIICGGTNNLQIAHYISRARLGLGTPQNLGTMCVICHYGYDNGNRHLEIKNLFRRYLQSHYDGWDENNLVYKKWRF